MYNHNNVKVSFYSKAMNMNRITELNNEIHIKKKQPVFLLISTINK